MKSKLKTLSKSILSLLLAFVMLFGAAPMSGLVGVELPSFSDFIKAHAAPSDNRAVVESATLMRSLFLMKVCLKWCPRSPRPM